jgi:hypothetical protein
MSREKFLLAGFFFAEVFKWPKKGPKCPLATSPAQNHFKQNLNLKVFYHIASSLTNAGITLCLFPRMNPDDLGCGAQLVHRSLNNSVMKPADSHRV